MSDDVLTKSLRDVACIDGYMSGGLFGATTLGEQAADEIERLRAEVERLRKALVEARTEVLWNAYHSGSERDGEWSHAFMSDGEWLASECGLDPTLGWYPIDAVRQRIPEAARNVLTEIE